MKTSFDVIVLGAGVMGASVAATLVESGLAVALVERGVAAGQGATRDTGGIVRGLELDPALRPLVEQGPQGIGQGIVHTLFEQAFRRTGVAYIANAETCGAYLDAVGRDGGLNVELHANVAPLDNGRFSAFCPQECLLIERNGGIVDARHAVMDLTRYVNERGTLLEQVAVESCVELADKVIVRAGNLRLEATWVVDATGGSTNLPRAPQTMHVRTIPFTRFVCDQAPSMPVIVHGLNTYLLPLSQTVVQAGGQRRTRASRIDQLDFAVRDNEQDVMARVGRLGYERHRSAAFSTRIACDAYTEDGRPLIGPIRADSHIYLATAFCGIGFKMAPGVSQLLASDILARHKGLPLEATHRRLMDVYRPSRFDQAVAS